MGRHLWFVVDSGGESEGVKLCKLHSTMTNARSALPAVGVPDD